MPFSVTFQIDTTFFGLLSEHGYLRIFQRNGLKLDKDLIFSGLVQNMYVYRMEKSKKI